MNLQLHDNYSVGVYEKNLDYHLESRASSQKLPIPDLEAKWKDMPDKYFIIVAHLLAGHINNSEAIDQFNGPILKASIKSVYWIFLIQYAALAVIGIGLNVSIIVYMVYHRFYRDVTHSFIVNLALCHFVQCALVLPITLMVMLIQNWIFGQFICFFLPMLQDIPLHVAIITHILIAWDRMRWLGYPLKTRLPAFVCSCATWLTGMVIALPYPIYTIYVEIGEYVPHLDGMGLCIINLMDDMHEYMRGLFVIMYCAPAVLLAYLYIRTSQELSPPDGPFAAIMYEQRVNMRNKQRNSSASSVDRSFNGGHIDGAKCPSLGSGLANLTVHNLSSTSNHLTSSVAAGGIGVMSNRAYDLYSAELDTDREKRNQRNYGSMAAAQVVCVCPLMILRFARLSMVETYDNAKHFDFTYLMFVWIAFLPTVIFPYIYASQILPITEQERLRGYFRLSASQFRKSGDATGMVNITRADEGSNDCSHNLRESFCKDTQTRMSQTENVIVSSDNYKRGVCSCDGQTLVTAPAEFRLEDKYKHHMDCNTLFQRSSSGSLVKERVHGRMKYPTKDQQKPTHAVEKMLTDNEATVIIDSVMETRKFQGDALTGQRRLTLDSLDNTSCLTSSTYCNRNSILLDDTVSGDFGDGEDSSITSGIILANRGSVRSGALAYYDKKRTHNSVSTLQQNANSISDCSLLHSSAQEQDMEMIDLQREKCKGIQDMIVSKGIVNERRRLPKIDKIYPQSPKTNRDSYGFDLSTSTTSSSRMSMRNNKTASTSMSLYSDPSQVTITDSYTAATTLNEDDRVAATRKLPKAENGNRITQRQNVCDEEEPHTFLNNYVSGEDKVKQIRENQYQYNRRLSRTHSHQSQSSTNSHRGPKRDSLNSLNGTDLIAGAFGELDPALQLTKISMIENPMRRSSGRNSSFSSVSVRSSLKSRDCGNGTTDNTHPELDLRENIFAEL